MKHDLDNLILEAQGGNGRAFADVYSFYANDLYRFALYFTGNSADAEDCVQEAVLLSFKNITSLKKPSAFKSWMFKILANVCKTKLSVPADRLYAVPIHEISDTAADKNQSDMVLSAELSDALNSLAFEEKQIVLLSVIGRYKSREIAEILDLQAGTVRSKLSRSLTKLRDILQ
ncbi:MAG: RNA polymerase sigma factor [Clostridiales bacterium]|nr:RNA polymerase sigma factor [Clostridiales bacterium]MCD7827525.1 RNA polymerase sigma factor [Clostridiales bacterium]